VVEKSDFSENILPPTNQMANAVIVSINYYHRDTARSQTCKHTLYSSLTTAGIDVSNYEIEA
jgi:hypothetical protein